MAIEDEDDEEEDLESYPGFIPHAADMPYDKCPNFECEQCARRDCPFGEPLHYHHDGCPACSEFWPVINEALWANLKEFIPQGETEAHLKLHYIYRDVSFAATDQILAALAKRGLLKDARKEEVAEGRTGQGEVRRVSRQANTRKAQNPKHS